jgi:fumarylacetoacetase
VTGFGAGANGLLWREDDRMVDLSGLGDVFAQPTLNPLLAAGPDAWREAIDKARAHDGPSAQEPTTLPFEVADYVDFYSSLEHATNLGRMFRPDSDPLLPNWRWLPVGYHGRAGTVVVSGTDVTRPLGQLGAGAYGPSKRLDIELELGFVVGVPTELGQTLTTADFEQHVFGVVLVNDWSARDIQAWEYQPLGPFLGKSFQTSISAWVTPLALLQDARVEAPVQEPPPLPHLAGGRDWALDLDLQIELNGETISRGNARGLYWTMPQQLAHATSNGATLRTGDLMASGTISGGEPGSEGSLIELWQNTRFLEDGDEVVLRGRTASVEVGEVRGRVRSSRIHT